jgi:hypothetical protein
MNLYEYFEKIKAALHLPEETELRYLPGKGGKYRGLVSKDGRTIFVFDEDEEAAKETLLHEVIDLLVTRLALALRDPEIARSNELYSVKEAVVEALRKLITEEEIAKKGAREQIVKELKRLGCEEIE